MKKEINRIRERALKVNINSKSKLVFMSDVHRGDGGFSDNLLPNFPIYYAALKYYYKNDFTYVEVGDGDELWENRAIVNIAIPHVDIFELLNKFKKSNRLYMLYGNHDMVKKDWNVEKKQDRKNPLKEISKLNRDFIYYESLEFNYENKGDFLVFHGHQGDFFNNKLWLFSRFLVRYIWRFGESILGFKAPTSPARNEQKKDKVDRILEKWSNEESCMIITGHTHRARFPESRGAAYFNTGCCVYPCAITSIEIEKGSISLIKWYTSTIENGVLAVTREVIAGPVSLENFI